MYRLIAVISVLIRQVYLPNPFGAIEEKIMISNIPIFSMSILLNLIMEPVIHVVTFRVVGLYYRRGENPALGSLLYLLFYCVHIFILWLMSLLEFKYWGITIIIIGYIMCHIGLCSLRNHINGRFI